MKMNAKKFLALVLVLIMTFALCATAFAYTKGDTLECTGSDVKVRKGPGTSYSKIGVLDKGDKVTFISKSGSWSKVEYNGQTAYVYSKYLKASSSAGSSGSSSSSSTMYATTGVRVRSGPGTSYAQVGSLTADQAVVRTGKSGSWVQISYNGTTAYVHGKYLTTVVPDGVDESIGSSGSSGSASSNTVVTKNATYVYRGPGQSYGVLYIVQANTSLTATGVVSGSFTQVNTPYGIGYVQTSTISGSVTNTSSVGTITTVTYLYKEASYASSNYGIVLPAGTQVTCTGVVSGAWAQVTYGGYTGYVHKDSVKTGSVNTGANSQGVYVRYVVAASAPVYDSLPTISSSFYGSGFGGSASSSTTITGANTIGSLTYGTMVTCVGESGSFTQIVYNNTSYGYVLTSNLSATLSGVSGGTSGTTGGTTSTTGGTALLNKTAYVYSAPGYGVLGTVNAGTTVVTTGTSGNYTQIVYNGTTYGYVETSALTILTTGSSVSGGSASQGYVTVKKGALIVNMTTYATETVANDTLVILVSQDASTSTAIIKDAAGTQYKVHTSYLSGSSSGSTTTYVTIKAGAMILNMSSYTYEAVPAATKVQLVSQNTAAGTVTVKDALGVQYVANASDVTY